ncbi:MAG: GNAT family N-acetyltransferase [Thermoguttaceae bacterium]|nr:GNAT family N-acetyltransferase [Thermoguttaceae bacterium]
MKIVPLCERMEFFDAVVQCLWNEWGKCKNLTLSFWECWVRSSLHPAEVPQTYIAISETATGDMRGEQLLGTVSLWRSDLQSRQDLTPWLGGLYVVPAFRGRGVASALQRYVLRRAASMSIPRLYLMTEHEHFYERTGWIFLGTSPHETGVDVRIYAHDTSDCDEA